MKDYIRFDFDLETVLYIFDTIFDSYFNRKTNVLTFKSDNKVYKYFVYNLNFYTTCLHRFYGTYK